MALPNRTWLNRTPMLPFAIKCWGRCLSSTESLRTQQQMVIKDIDIATHFFLSSWYANDQRSTKAYSLTSVVLDTTLIVFVLNWVLLFNSLNFVYLCYIKSIFQLFDGQGSFYLTYHLFIELVWTERTNESVEPTVELKRGRCSFHLSWISPQYVHNTSKPLRKNSLDEILCKNKNICCCCFQRC